MCFKIWVCFVISLFLARFQLGQAQMVSSTSNLESLLWCQYVYQALLVSAKAFFLEFPCHKLPGIMVCLACYATMYEEEVVQSLMATILPPLFSPHVGEIEFWWVKKENT